VTAKTLVVADDASIAEFARRIGTLEHVVSTASARARGALAKVNCANLLQTLGTKVLGPTMLAKYFAPHMRSSGSFVLFSGVNTVKATSAEWASRSPTAPSTFLTRSLTVELAPIRVNAILQGGIDTGISHPIGVGAEGPFFDHDDAGHPGCRGDTVDSVARTVLFAMTNGFMTVVMLTIAGEESLV
jgi:NAD(P)-dependent dehydrogenase (short-subunit alcohol dehydrogenase family)